MKNHNNYLFKILKSSLTMALIFVLFPLGVIASADQNQNIFKYMIEYIIETFKDFGQWLKNLVRPAPQPEPQPQPVKELQVLKQELEKLKEELKKLKEELELLLKQLREELRLLRELR